MPRNPILPILRRRRCVTSFESVASAAAVRRTGFEGSHDGIVRTYRGFRACRPSGAGPRERAPALLDQAEAGRGEASLRRGPARGVLLRVRQTDPAPRAGSAAR